jgi:hypothetical protein
MTILSTEALTTILNTLVENPRWSAAAKAVGCTERTCFAFVAGSRNAAKQNPPDTASVYFLEFMGTFDFFHIHCATSRRLQLIRLEGIVRAEAAAGTQEPVLDSNHRQVWLEDAAAVAFWKDDAQAAKDIGGLEDFPFAHDSTGARIPLMRSIPMAATLRGKVLEQISSYTPHSTVDIKSHNTHEVVRRSGAPGRSPIPESDGALRVKLLAQAAQHLSSEGRVTQPEGKAQTGYLIPVKSEQERAREFVSTSDKVPQDRRGRTTTGGPVGFNMNR